MEKEMNDHKNVAKQWWMKKVNKWKTSETYIFEIYIKVGDVP